MGIFGWSYPPGAANDPYAPYNQTDEPCAVCGKFPDDCICPECPTCGDPGNPGCYENHGLVRSQEQIDSMEALHEIVEQFDFCVVGWADAFHLEEAFGITRWKVEAMSAVERECWVSLALAMPSDSYYVEDLSRRIVE